MRTYEQWLGQAPAAPTRWDVAARIGRYRTLCFATALTMSVVFPLALWPLLGRPVDADCFAHWSYGAGELIALVSTVAIGLRQAPLAVVAHGVVSLAWVFLVSRSCHLWIALWTGAAAPHLLHPM